MERLHSLGTAPWGREATWVRSAAFMRQKRSMIPRGKIASRHCAFLRSCHLKVAFRGRSVYRLHSLGTAPRGREPSGVPPLAGGKVKNDCALG